MKNQQLGTMYTLYSIHVYKAFPSLGSMISVGSILSPCYEKYDAFIEAVQHDATKIGHPDVFGYLRQTQHHNFVVRRFSIKRNPLKFYNHIIDKNWDCRQLQNTLKTKCITHVHA